MGRNARKVITRDKIMRAAVAQFGEKGYNAASIQSIVEEADVAHGTIFWHFGNKEKLYMEVARWAGNQFYDAMHVEIERDGPPPTIVELAQKQYEYLKKNPEVGHLSLAIVYEAIGPHPELGQAMRLFNRRITDVWRQWALRCAEAGTLRSGYVPEEVGTLIATTLAGVNIGSHVHRWEDARHHFELVGQIFEQGCLIPGAQSPPIASSSEDDKDASIEPRPAPHLRSVGGGRA